MKRFLRRNQHIFWMIVLFILLFIVFIFCFATWAIAKVTYYTLDGGRPLIYQANHLDKQTNLNQSISSYLLEKPIDRLPLSAGAYLVTDLSSKEVVVRKNENRVLPIASVTKLVTAIVAQEFLDPDQEIVVTEEAWSTYGNTGQLKVGEKIPLKIALYPLLLTSSNDMAEAIALTVGRGKFLARMNEFAKGIGMTNTHFADPSGLSPDNLSTPADLSKLASHLYNNKPDILTITREESYRYRGRTWSNYNNVSLMKYYLGGKNGYTDEANRTLVSLFEVPINNSSSSISQLGDKKNHLLAVVLLQSEDKKKDTRNLIDFLSHYVSYDNETSKNGFIPLSPDETIDQ
ncbi:MAG TPA: serine hydrolase [Candidatus Paceibacterota bacterium]|nr:serine hydrolase [Candidatus Paceibacterota bacterium]